MAATWPMRPGAGGWWSSRIRSACPPATFDYGYLLDGADDLRGRPAQPRGSRAACTGRAGPSTRARTTGRTRAWTGRQLAGAVIYELHIGTFTPAGTLDAAIDKLDHLVDLGVDFVELLPVNAFNGDHNWGYDGVLWYAVQESYGGPAGYQRFVDACHATGPGA